MGKKKFRPRSHGNSMSGQARGPRSGGNGNYGGRGGGGGGGGGQGGGGGGRGGRRHRPFDSRSRGPSLPGTQVMGEFDDQAQQQQGEGAMAGPEVPLEEGYGMLEMHPNGYGFLRSPENNYSRERSDPFVPGTMIERYGLRQGLVIKGLVQQPRKQQGPRLREITDVDGMLPDDYLKVKSFDQLTPINPDKWYKLETGPQPLSTRVMDLLTPLGRGQRALIVAAPRTGKTILLQHIANGIATNYPE